MFRKISNNYNNNNNNNNNNNPDEATLRQETVFPEKLIFQKFSCLYFLNVS